MSAGFLKRAAAVLAILIAGWLGLSVVRSNRDGGSRLELPGFDRSSVDRVVIEGSSDTVRLDRQGAGWTVNGMAADHALVTRLLETVADTAASTELIAASPTSHERLGVDSGAARRLRLSRGTTSLVDVLVGKRGSSYESVYLRRPGSDEVYLKRGGLAEAIERKADDWRDKQIVAVEPDSVVAVAIRLGRKSYQLTRAATGWTVDGAPADSAAVATLLERFKDLAGSGFASKAEADSADFAAPERTVRLEGTGNRLLAALAFDSTSGAFWVRRDGDATVFRLERWTADPLTPPDTTFRAR